MTSAKNVTSNQAFTNCPAMSVLHRAVSHHNARQVRLLTRAGSGVNRRDSRMRTPMHLVCYVANEKLALSLAKILLQNGACVGHKDEVGVSAFSCACTQQRARLVELMINEREIDWVDVDHHGNTALHHAVLSGNKIITQMVMTEMLRYGIDIDLRNARGETPMILAAKYGHTECANVLRDEGRACVTVRDTTAYKTSEEWRGTLTEIRPLRVSRHFRNKFPDVSEQLVERIQLKQPLVKKPHDSTKAGPTHHNKGKSVKLHIIPGLLHLYNEQFMTSYRPPARPRSAKEKEQKKPEVNQVKKTSFIAHHADNTDEDRGASSLAKKRKATSFAGFAFHRQPGENEPRLRKHSTTFVPSYKAFPGPRRCSALGAVEMRAHDTK